MTNFTNTNTNNKTRGGQSHQSNTAEMVRNVQLYDCMHTRLYKANTLSNSIEASQMHSSLINFDLVENVAAAQSRLSGPLGEAVAKAVGLFKAPAEVIGNRRGRWKGREGAFLTHN